ncbi:MAG: hypothetical protein R3F19_27260 [Verrucomicrobiales bacterium]
MRESPQSAESPFSGGAVSPFTPSSVGSQYSAPVHAAGAPMPFSPSTAPFAPSSAGGASHGAPPFAPSKAPVAPISPPPLAPSPASESVAINLRSLLVDLPLDVLGFDPGRIPDTMKVVLPTADLMSQVPTGKVAIKLGEVVNALEPQFRAAFANGKMDTSVKIPLQALYSASPNMGAAPAAFAGTPPRVDSPAPAPVAPAPQPESEVASPPPFQQRVAPSPFASPPSASPSEAISSPAFSAQEPLSPAPSPLTAQSSDIPPEMPVVPSSPPEAVKTRAELDDAPISGTVFKADAGIDDDVLKPLKWDPQAKSTKLVANDAPVSSPPPPLKMPTAPNFDDDESQPLDSLSAPVPPAAEDLNPAAAAVSNDKPAPSLVPKGPILAPKSGTAAKPDAKPAVSEAPKSGLPQLGLGKPPVATAESAKARKDSAPAVAKPQSAEAERASKQAPKQPVPVSAKPASPTGGRIARSPDFVLRALLSMDGTPTCENVVDHCVELPGVSECLVLRAGAVVPGSKRSGSSGALAAVTEGAFEKVTGLVREMGISTADALTIQLDSGTLSFFVDDSACLAVLQENSAQLGPGVRERLTLISQQLGTIPLA